MIYELPVIINVGGVEYRICGDGDYRAILDIFSILEDISLSKEERLYTALVVFYCLDDMEDLLHFPIEEAVTKMYGFFNAGRPKGGASSSTKLVDWENDGSMIVSAINHVAGKEIRAERYLHWWTFLSYYMSVGESVLSTVLSIREKIVKGKKLEKWEKEYRTKNPEYFVWESKTVDERDIEAQIIAQWNGG